MSGIARTIGARRKGLFDGELPRCQLVDTAGAGGQRLTQLIQLRAVDALAQAVGLLCQAARITTVRREKSPGSFEVLFDIFDDRIRGNKRIPNNSIYHGIV